MQGQKKWKRKTPNFYPNTVKKSWDAIANISEIRKRKKVNSKSLNRVSGKNLT